MSDSIQNVFLFGDPAAHAEVEEVLKRLEEKHGASETGKGYWNFSTWFMNKDSKIK